MFTPKFHDRYLSKNELIELCFSASRSDGSLSAISKLTEIPLKEVLEIVKDLRQQNKIDKDTKFDDIEKWHPLDFTKYFYKKSIDSFGAFIKPEYGKDSKLIQRLLENSMGEGINPQILKSVIDFVTVRENWIRICRELKLTGFPNITVIVGYWNSIVFIAFSGFKPSVHESVSGNSNGKSSGW